MPNKKKRYLNPRNTQTVITIRTRFLTGTGCSSPFEAVKQGKRDVLEWCELLKTRERKQAVKQTHELIQNHSRQRTISPSRQAVLECLTKPMTPTEIADVLGRSGANTRNLIRSMKIAGLVQRLENGRYTYTPKATS